MMRWILAGLVALGIVVSVVAWHAVSNKSTASPTATAAPAVATDTSVAVIVPTVNQTPVLYLGVPIANAVALLGTPTDPNEAFPGYGNCLTFPGYAAWAIGSDPKTGRVNYMGPRSGCLQSDVNFSGRSNIALPPDAKKTGEDSQPDDPDIYYFSAWLKGRTGCGSIVVSGSKEKDGWVATLGCP